MGMPVYNAVLLQHGQFYPKYSQASPHNYPDSKVHGANMGPIWGRQDPGGPHVGPMKFAIWVACEDVAWVFLVS